MSDLTQPKDDPTPPNAKSSQAADTAARPALDDEGYLAALSDWTPEVANWLAEGIGLQLTPEHWELINLVREFHQRTDVVPAMRPLVKLTRAALGDAKGSSLHINLLFPNGAAKNLARVAGLPKPTNCL